MAGTWAIAIWVGNGVNDGAMQAIGVLGCGGSGVLVVTSTGGTVNVASGTIVCIKGWRGFRMNVGWGLQKLCHNFPQYEGIYA